jgi:uncharacterized protein
VANASACSGELQFDVRILSAEADSSTLKRAPRAVCWISLLLAFALSAFALDTSKLKPSGYVNDFAKALDPAGKAQIEAFCTSLEQTTGVQMAIVTVDTLDDEPVEDVGNRLFREWGIGKKGKDNGVLMLFAIKDHKSSVELGYGIEPIISDGDAGTILRGIRPILRQGNYSGALLAAAQQIGSQIATAQGVELPGVQHRPIQRGRPPAPHQSIPLPLIIIGFVVILWLFSKLSGGGRGGFGGGGTGFLTGMILGNMMGRGGSGWGGGGFGGGGSGGGGGFGGFGGGDSGGGGASSDW